MQLIGRKKVERRRWKRYPFVAPVRVVTDSAVVDARCIRMSEGGIYLFAAADLPTGAEVKVEVALGRVSPRDKRRRPPIRPRARRSVDRYT